MTKWDYIRLISQRGDAYGCHGGVLELLHWCEKLNTESVTLEEAKAYWENPCQPYADVKRENPEP